MNKYIYTYSRIFKKDIIFMTMIFILLMWAISSTVFGLQKKEKIVVIEKTDLGSKIVGINDDSSEQEIQVFLRRFLILYYSFDEKSYSKNMDLSTNLMSQTLFDKLSLDIKKRTELFKTGAFLQTAEVLSLSKISEDKFEAEIKISETKNGSDYSQNFKIELDLIKSELSVQNPWGYEIISLIEKRI